MLKILQFIAIKIGGTLVEKDCITTLTLEIFLDEMARELRLAISRFRH
jgi:hypothetical protein